MNSLKKNVLDSGEFHLGMRLTKDLKLNKKKRPKNEKKNDIFVTKETIKMPTVCKTSKKDKTKPSLYQFKQSLEKEGANQDLYQFRG
tara:strand:- start:2635 stop:2895 length:261 start_codon:yes stop_codon:yes gene_type:complete